MVNYERADLLHGTLNILVLKALLNGPQHGYGIAAWIEGMTNDVLQVGEGSLYPTLRRLEARKLVRSSWGYSTNNRKARFYAITAAGRTHLTEEAERWMTFSAAVTHALRSVAVIQ